MPKYVIVTCSQTVTYQYEIEIPDGFNIEEYVYAYRANCDEYIDGDTTNSPVIIDWGDITVEDIEEDED
jgi:hypothetical protein